jgi:hypothetical protein
LLEKVSPLNGRRGLSNENLHLSDIDDRFRRRFVPFGAPRRQSTGSCSTQFSGIVMPRG